MTERYGKTRRPSGTMATPRATISSGRSPSIRRPSRTISPAASRASPVIARNVVVLPAPFAPMRATMSPSSSSTDTSVMARTWSYRTERSAARK